MNWEDAFGATITVGSLVAYSRMPKGGGGYVYVVGRVVGPANLSPDGFVKIELSDDSLEFLKSADKWMFKTGERTRPIQKIVPSVCTTSCISLEGHPKFK